MLKNLKLASKTSIIIGIILVVSLSIMVGISAILASRAVEQGISGEFEGISAQNGIMVQNIIDSATSAAKDMEDYLLSQYKNYEIMSPEERSVKMQSKVYDVMLETIAYESENYMLNTAWSLLKNNHDIIAFCALFEPDSFDPSIRDYSIFIDIEGAANRTASPSDAYSVYSNEDYYSVAKNTRKPEITEPYAYDGKKVISASYPIVYKDKVMGVIVIDIDVERFGDIKTTDPKYPTMYTNIYTNKFTLAFDSDSLDFVGKNLSDLIPANDFERISEKAKEGVSFSIETKRDNGSIVTRYFYPITCGSEIWWAGSTLDTQDLRKDINGLLYIMILIALIVTAAIICTIAIVLKKLLKPIISLNTVAKELSEGKLNSNISYRSNDEIGQLSDSVRSVQFTISSLIEKLTTLINQYQKGNTDERIDEEQFSGEYKTVANGINSLCNSFVDDTEIILESFGAIGNGDFDVTLKQFPGKKATANEKFEELKTNIINLNSDITRLIEGAINGELETRVAPELYNGGWKTLTEGLNNLLSAVSKPIQEANEVISQLSNGNFDIKVSNDHKGAFAKMMHSLDFMVQTVGSYINEITEILDTIASGDLRETISRDYVGNFSLIKASINNINLALKNTVNEIKASSDNVLNGAKQISDSAMNLAIGASNQASTVEELNASITVINEKTNLTANETKTANEYSQESMKRAREGSEEMLKMVNYMDEIKDASNSISKIIKVIDDIAFQTNLLALNAAVEAARAGEHGKGFSVVAEEVRTLAGRSLEAAKDTAALIEDTTNKINVGANAAQQTASSLEKIVSDIKTVSDIINSINIATEEQTEGINQISVGINQISEVVQNNSSTSEESASAAQELNSQSEVLVQMVSKFKV